MPDTIPLAMEGTAGRVGVIAQDDDVFRRIQRLAAFTWSAIGRSPLMCWRNLGGRIHHACRPSARCFSLPSEER